MNTINVLQQGRARIDHGWAKGQGFSIRDGRYRYCALGAVLGIDLDSSEQAVSYLRLALQSISPGGYDHVESWNDAFWRRKKDILKLYDIAIKLAQEDAVKPSPQPVSTDWLEEAVAVRARPTPISLEEWYGEDNDQLVKVK